jgi:hypothetical protein
VSSFHILGVISEQVRVLSVNQRDILIGTLFSPSLVCPVLGEAIFEDVIPFKDLDVQRVSIFSFIGQAVQICVEKRFSIQATVLS